VSDHTSKAQNDHNVYILGAGFSAEAGLPLIKDFMNRMRDAAAWLDTEGERKEEITAIERVLDFRLQAACQTLASGDLCQRRSVCGPRLE
jgi:hypothetical protein